MSDARVYNYDRKLHDALDAKQTRAERDILQHGHDPDEVADRYDIDPEQLPDPSE